MRRISRKDQKKVEIVTQAIMPEPDPIPPAFHAPVLVRSNMSRPQSPKVESTRKEEDNAVPCYLISKDGFYEKNGKVVVFVSKSAAKRERNILNQKLKKSTWAVMKLLKGPDGYISPIKTKVQNQTINEPYKFDDVTEDELHSWGGWTGYVF